MNFFKKKSVSLSSIDLLLKVFRGWYYFNEFRSIAPVQASSGLEPAQLNTNFVCYENFHEVERIGNIVGTFHSSQDSDLISGSRSLIIDFSKGAVVCQKFGISISLSSVSRLVLLWHSVFLIFNYPCLSTGYIQFQSV